MKVRPLRLVCLSHFPSGARLPAGATPHCLTVKGLRLKIEEGLKDATLTPV